MLFVLTGVDPERLKKLPRRDMTFRLLHKACARQGVEMLLTTPTRVNVARGIVRGWSLSPKDGSWTSRQCSLTSSSVIYDAMYLADLRAAKAAYRRLMQQLRNVHIPLFNPKLPAKDGLYALLGGDGGQLDQDVCCCAREVQLVPQTQLHVSEKRVREFLQAAQGPFWLKPIYGSGGRNMLRVSPIGGGQYAVQGERFYDRNILAEWSEAQLMRRVQRAMAKQPYMLQENVPLLETKDGRKVDFRVTLGRGDQGIWEVTAITARFGKLGSALTNFHAGGSVLSLTDVTDGRNFPFLGDFKLNLTNGQLDGIRRAATEAATCISGKYQNVGVLGIDVGLSSVHDGVYVYDCNSRPGRDILTDREIERVMNQIAGFSTYLSRQSKPGREYPLR